MIIIQPKANDEIISDAVSAFPDECCGFFYGVENKAGTRNITNILRVDNSKEGDKKRRYEISPQDYLRAEQYAEENKLELLGVYHSHPNHPAIPSETDRASAQTFFSYIIISVIDDNNLISGQKNSISEQKNIVVRCWRLNDEQQFEEETISDYQVTG
jgi:proteasome lid subunit RPN8/RPN11